MKPNVHSWRVGLLCTESDWSAMLSKLNAKGLTEEEDEMLNDIMGELSDTDDADTGITDAVFVSRTVEPNVMVMKRQR